MFGYRKDGKRIKCEDITIKMTPHFMPDRNDALNSIMHPVRVEDMDKWIVEKSEKERTKTLRCLRKQPQCSANGSPMSYGKTLRNRSHKGLRATVQRSTAKCLRNDCEEARL